MPLLCKVHLICILFLLWINQGSSQTSFDSSTVHFQEVIYFDSGKFNLVDSNYVQLDSMMSKTKNIQDFQFFIDAYTDDVGSNESNLKLSENRKQSILSYLQQKGLSDTLITSKFHGENKLLSLEKDPQSRQLNRRATVQLISTKKYIYLKGHIVDEDSNEGIKAEIELDSKTHFAKTVTDSTGHFKIIAPLQEIVAIHVYAKNYLLESNILKITERHIEKMIKVPLPKVELGKRFNLKNMLFHGGQSRMLAKSKKALNSLTKFMFVNQDVCIEIAGHVNVPNKPKVKKNTSHFELSVARSLVVNNELQRSGIQKERMLSKGYGNWRMVYPYAKAPTHQEANRRVEIVISHCDSVELMENDHIKNPERYGNIAIERKYTKEFFQEDLRGLSITASNAITQQIKWLMENSKNPSDYTYKQLIIQYRDRIAEKE